MKQSLLFFLVIFLASSCDNKKEGVPTVAFIDAFQDNTIAMAKQGFFDALSANGYDEKKGTINVIYRNAQGDIPTLTQITRYMISQQPDLIAANATLPTITAIQNTKDIPVFMMVSGTPQLLKLTDAQGKEPSNLFGVGETIAYIDTSFGLIPLLIKPKGSKIRVGMVFNQSEPQSVHTIEEISKLAAASNMELISLPVNASADVQLVTQSLLSKQVDVFFANPDNTIFSSFESILKACDEKQVPILTSEAGLVARGALAAFGADIYQWGYQSGLQAAAFLKAGSTKDLHWEMVKQRNRVYNPEMAKKYNIAIPEGFKPL
ncbi:MAG: ABC transporter substrate-binding protein [Chitinophagia bacterium]|jgi:putative ABC transport system substrate-binding protein